MTRLEVGGEAPAFDLSDQTGTKVALSGFALLADEDHAVAEAYAVWVEKSMYGKKHLDVERSALLVDEHGLIAEAWYRISPEDTPVRLVAALRERDVPPSP